MTDTDGALKRSLGMLSEDLDRAERERDEALTCYRTLQTAHEALGKELAEARAEVERLTEEREAQIPVLGLWRVDAVRG